MASGSARRSRLTIGLLAGAVVLAACTSDSSSGSDEAPPNASPQASAASPMQLKVMEFNIEYGGDEVDFSSVPAAIEAADADVVGLEEAEGNTAQVAEVLGWDYYEPALQIISRYPLLMPAESEGLYTYVEVEPGRVAAIGNVHLPSAPYGPFQIGRNGLTAKEMTDLEHRARLPELEPTLEALTELSKQGIPTFLMGDFNAPSHLDWTEEAVGLRDHVKYAFDWPVSTAVEQAGFVDSYREIHPDPVENQGLTWPASRPHVKGYNPGPNGAEADRIDFIYAGGAATPTGSVIVGEQGGDSVEIVVEPWPTDHRAVVSTFEIEPADAPTLVALQQRVVEVGDEVTVLFDSLDEGAVPTIAGPEPDATEVDVAGASTTEGTMTFATDGWEPGTYQAMLSDGSVVRRAPFWVQEPGTGPVVRTLKRSYREDEPIEVEWTAGPGNRWDWVGIYKRGANPNVAWYILWEYTQASVEGRLTFDKDAHGPWPLKPGKYSVYLLEDDGYHKLAGGNFTVAG